MDYRGKVQFAAGVDIAETMQELYDTEYKYERRHKHSFADIEQTPGNAFFDVVGGRYPTDGPLAYIPEGYREIFSPEKLAASADTAKKFLKEGYAGALWVSRHGLNESLGRGFSDETFCVFDPTDAGDVIDLWNFRLVERRLTPISMGWFAEHSEFVRERILAIHRPIPGNSSGTKFHSSELFGASIPDEARVELTRTHLSDLPDRSFFSGRPPLLWESVARGRDRREAKIIATGKSISFDEELGSERYLKLPAPTPSFLNATRRYTKGRWVNLVVADELHQRADPAIVYPSNLWSPEYPRLGSGRDLRIGREGWALQQEHEIGYSLLEPQEGRAAIIGWLKTQGIEATPSEEGQVASRVIATADTLLACGMFADRKTLQLLNEMAESHTEVHRNGKKTVKSVPDRSKHYQEVRRHFEERSKRSFGFWNNLDYFLNRSVFRAGLRVQCPICAYYNWFALDALGYKPTCSRCLNQFEFSQAPQDLHRLEWYYRLTGPFAAPDYARGGYAVALTLRSLAPQHDTNITWATGLRLAPLGCEIDFVAWHRPTRMGRDERDEPILVLGEAKSFGVGSINDETIHSLKKVAESFPGAVLVVSTLREIDEYSLAEIARLRHLALWGRRKTHQAGPINPLVVLTGTELFARHGIADAWKQVDGKEMHPSVGLDDLHTLADLTQHRYLGLQSYWDRRDRSDVPEHMGRLLAAIRGRWRE
ncbi:MAG: hypothetical protein E5W70_16210 [Mesorhizobium sp.]|uniref:hypothetical protein n=1 Tax=Mesorhizobium sp. TaxID=1871066 RepID=UPI00120A5E7E|nr:hypothetical protein [Mesorhizobium sp.]TIT21630.1 MAG: hypothetical protein E5W70_16210 [Mesorhizobium sp.]